VSVQINDDDNRVIVTVRHSTSIKMMYLTKTKLSLYYSTNHYMYYTSPHTSLSTSHHSSIIACKKAKLQAGIKPTALCSTIDKENSMEFPLDSLHYLYNYYMVCALLSHAYHVTYHVTSCDVML